jgi:hypothetical protein
MARTGEIRNVQKILVGKPEWKRPLVRHRGKREDNIKMDLREIGRDGFDWIHLDQDRSQSRASVNTVIQHRGP